MELVHWVDRPVLRRPLLVTAFAGWNDAGDAATLALDQLARQWGAKTCATIDPEEFYDFTVTRPAVRHTSGPGRRIEWPRVELLAAEVPDAGHDLLLLRGAEPQLRWRGFCAAVVAMIKATDAELVVILGALLADVPHTRPVRVTGTTTSGELAKRVGLGVPTYEGPTGIVGVLLDALHQAGLPAASLWAAVPHYVHQLPSPKAALALLERSAPLLGVPFDPVALQTAALEYEREVSERVADDDEAAAYVAQLEDAEDSDAAGADSEGATPEPDEEGSPDSREEGSPVSGEAGSSVPGQGGLFPPDGGDDLAAEVERFLRDQRREG
jgi:proteasome assembly chaperone (PAC2) family protein